MMTIRLSPSNAGSSARRGRLAVERVSGTAATTINAAASMATAFNQNSRL
jgi:hypothetical protein